jgi:hypothetical protein
MALGLLIARRLAPGRFPRGARTLRASRFASGPTRANVKRLLREQRGVYRDRSRHRTSISSMRCKRVSTRSARLFHFAHVLYSTSERYAREPIGRKSVELGSEYTDGFPQLNRMFEDFHKTLGMVSIIDERNHVCVSSRGLAALTIECGHITRQSQLGVPRGASSVKECRGDIHVLEASARALVPV